MENTYLVIGALLVVVILLIWAYRSDGTSSASNTKLGALPSSMNEKFSGHGGSGGHSGGG